MQWYSEDIDGTPFAGKPAIAIEVGSYNWVPILNNGDNTFTASWLLPVTSLQGFELGSARTFSITFAEAPAPVPVPASLYLFVSGFVILVFRKGKIRLNSEVY